jgi:hypothetical protein
VLHIATLCTDLCSWMMVRGFCPYAPEKRSWFARVRLSRKCRYTNVLCAMSRHSPVTLWKLRAHGMAVTDAPVSARNDK